MFLLILFGKECLAGWLFSLPLEVDDLLVAVIEDNGFCLPIVAGSIYENRRQFIQIFCLRPESNVILFM